MFFTRFSGILLACLLAVLRIAAGEPAALSLRTNDLVVLVGGSDVAAAQFTGHLETLLAVKFPGARFRNLGWEGDTVFVQPRDIGFPPVAEQLRRTGSTVVFLQFGRAEALSGREPVEKFASAYDRFVDGCLKRTPSVLLITPVPFESGSEPLPDLSSRNATLAAHVEVIRDIARQRGLPLVDLFKEFGGAAPTRLRLTEDGLQLTPRGQGLVATGFMRQLGFGEIAGRAGDLNPQGVWSNGQIEQLRQIVREKNQLWFNYWRPQNWAFLGGDRTSQPSSRDHRDPKVRWFPAEMEKYGPLIQAKEEEIERAAAVLRGADR